MTKPIVLTIVLLLLLAGFSQLKAQQPYYTTQTVNVGGATVQVYSRGSSEAKPQAAIETIIKGKGTDANTNACVRTMIWYKNTPSVMEAQNLAFKCDYRTYEHTDIEPGEYIFGGFPIAEDEIVTVAIEINGKTTHTEMVSYNTRNTMRKLTIPVAATVTVVIRQQ